ncbi:MAG: metallophosphoesterase [Tannerellaceae bacterium]|jgi:predicted MPP superfamily phosphohydrolase|nr:metallophosphoesterase [Tannerellaceae bacterium]
MRTPLFIIIALAIVIGAHYYIFHRLWHIVPSQPGRIIVVSLGVLAFASLVLNFFVADVAPLKIVSLVYRVGMSWLVIFLYLLLLLAATDLLRLLPFGPFGRILPAGWMSFGLISAIITLILVVGNITYRHKDRVELNLSIAKQAGSIKELTIVAISDLHLGGAVGKAEFESWLPLIDAEKPDIILIAGDIIDSHLRPMLEGGFAESLGKLRAPLGVFAAVGNHEFIANVDGSEAFLQSAGISVLRDSAVLVADAFYVAARDDYSNRSRKPLAGIVAGLDSSRPIILLDHQPHKLAEASLNGIDLQISGHTHNGQVWPLSIFTGMMFEKTHGYLQKEAAHIYVSSGIGIWGGKYRIGSRSEYVVIRLKFEA